MSDVPKTVRLILTCSTGNECIVAFEPEGAVHKLLASESFTIEVSGPGSGEVEITYDGDGVSVHAWPPASTTVWNDAGEIVPT